MSAPPLPAAVRLTECAVNDVLGLGATVKVKEADASISLRIPGGLSQTSESTCQTLLTALMVHFTSLHEEYPPKIFSYWRRTNLPVRRAF